MLSTFIFCLLAMYYIVSANPPPCPMEMGIPGVPCRMFCQYADGNTDLIEKANETPCKRPGGHPGKCKYGHCE
uniref:Putative salivary kunitz domain protein n=1 Tax=Ixodes ricinus TaxID=34613 RepID=A0A0K8R8M4_IXORI